MRVLIAEDDAISRSLLEEHLTRFGYSVVATRDGSEAWEALSGPDAPRLAVLDWMMPRMDGVEVCRRVRAEHEAGYVYLILLTARGRPEDRVTGFRAGADDYLVKPFDVTELGARLAVGQRILERQDALSARVAELTDALGRLHVQPIPGPICPNCGSRDDGSKV